MGFFKSLLQDEQGAISSKRVAGLICVLCLNASLIINTISPKEHQPSAPIVNAISLLAFGCLGLTTFDKYTKMKSDIEQPNTEE